ncbi:CCA-adding enzyme [bacterium BMS3Bbin10]|nr:CCA-adding enzyme [bacterium BMS3Bbin10]
MSPSHRDSLPSLAGADWLAWPGTRKVFATIGTQGFDIRAVGGAVRDALLSRRVQDVDFATTAGPETVMELARDAGLKVIATGLDHGTVTVVAGGRAFEVTTLRKDVETYGRRAKVSYTDDWLADARRRDFTINALYADADGTLHDPLGVIGDVAARHIRFIGDPRERVREDYLRILRFFRFNAQLGDGDFDAAALDACVSARAGLQGLSAERVNSEMMRLLRAPGAAEALRKMFEYGLLVQVLAGVPFLGRLEKLIAVEAHLGQEPDAVLRLGALAVAVAEDAARLTGRLRLSNADGKRLEEASRFHGLTPDMDDAGVRAGIHAVGRSGCRDRALMAWAASQDMASDTRWRDLVTRIGEAPAPKFPLLGADIVGMGVPQGPAVGEILGEIETRWIAGGFALGRAKLLDMARGLVASRSGGTCQEMERERK